MKTILIVLVVVGVAVAFYGGCSKEENNTSLDRVVKVVKGWVGEVVEKSQERDTPKIVEDQQRKERRRQNTQWTAENQRLHPLEYCQAQLDETVKMGKNLDVQQHKLLTAKSSLSKKIEQFGLQTEDLTAFLSKAKVAYKEADMVNGFPIQLNGHVVSKEQAQQLMLEASRKLKSAQDQLTPAKTALTQVERNLARIDVEKKKLEELRGKLKSTINNIQLKNVVDGGENVGNALQAIDDSMNALLQTAEIPEPSALDAIMTPDRKVQDGEEFEALLK